MKSNVRVLVLNTGTQALAIVHALNIAGYKVYLFCEQRSNYAGVSRFVDKRICAKVSLKYDESLSALIEVINSEKIDVVIPMGDVAAEFLSKHKSELEPIVKFQSPDYKDFLYGYDKNRLMRLCNEKGYPHPLTLDMSSTEIDSEVVRKFPYPALLKPNLTTGGRGMVRVDSHNALKEQYPALHEEYGDYHLQQFVAPGGRQVKVQLYINEDMTLRAATMIEKRRWYPVSGGSNCCAVSVYDQATIDLCHNVLKDLNWLGFADFDMIEDPATHQLLIMEINPRVPACIKSPIAAGVNWAQVIVEGALNRPATEFDYKQGVVLRHLGLDVLWFLQSPERWRSKPRWFRFFGNNVHYQDMSGWSDPLPFICGTWRNVKQVLSGHGKGKV